MKFKLLLWIMIIVCFSLLVFAIPGVTVNELTQISKDSFRVSYIKGGDSETFIVEEPMYKICRDHLTDAECDAWMIPSIESKIIKRTTPAPVVQEDSFRQTITKNRFKGGVQ